MTDCKEIGHYEAIKNGIPLKYRIQTITPDLADKALELMVTQFLTREPITSYEKFLEDPEPLENIKDLWRGAMSAGACLVALEDTDDGSVNIIGANMTTVVEKDEKIDVEKYCEKYAKLLTALIDTVKAGNIFERYNIDRYLGAYGLTVHPKYQGYQVGYRLLQARKPLCEAIGVTASGTLFTAQVSQHIARKVGFEVLSQQDYKTFIYKGQIAFPNLDGDMKFMGIKYK